MQSWWMTTRLSLWAVHQYSEGAQSLALTADMGSVSVHHHAVPDCPAATCVLPAGTAENEHIWKDVFSSTTKKSQQGQTSGIFHACLDYVCVKPTDHLTALRVSCITFDRGYLNDPVVWVSLFCSGHCRNEQSFLPSVTSVLFLLWQVCREKNVWEKKSCIRMRSKVLTVYWRP